MAKALLVMTALALSLNVSAETNRSYMAKKRFKLANPCPANGRTHGKCPDYIMDHIIPLCAGGADHQDNMQWQTVKAAKQKDVLEIKLCKCVKE